MATEDAPGNGPFEQALAGSLQRAPRGRRHPQFDRVGSSGRTFRLACHNAARAASRSSGFSVDQLRDNGKVYTKAAVEVR